MSFAQNLARNANSYGAETDRLMDLAVDQKKKEIMEACEAASMSGAYHYSGAFSLFQHPVRARKDWTIQHDHRIVDKVRASLLELGVASVDVYIVYAPYELRLNVSVNWPAHVGACEEEAFEHSFGGTCGTCVTCPICQEHRPAVVLIPCGHVICRDCHRSQQLRQCPMCRGPITSATNGLFMDWREHRGQWWDWMRWMDLDRFLPLPSGKDKIEKFLQFWRVFEMSSCSWLAWFRREPMQDACIARCLTFSTRWNFAKNRFVHFVSMSPHLIPRIMWNFGIRASWSFLCSVSSFPNVVEHLVNIPLTAATCLQCHLGALRSLCGHNITYTISKQTTARVFDFGNFSRLIPRNSKPKSGFVAFWCRSNDSDVTMCEKRCLYWRLGCWKTLNLKCRAVGVGGRCPFRFGDVLFRRFALEPFDFYKSKNLEIIIPKLVMFAWEENISAYRKDQEVYLFPVCSSFESPFAEDVPCARRFQMICNLEQGNRLIFSGERLGMEW